MNVRTALQQGADLFEKNGTAAPRLTAEVLLAYTLHSSREYLYAHPEQELLEVEWLHYGRYLHERLKGKPTQYITQRQEFYGREFRVSPDVLIPRPETEFVIEAALALDPRPRSWLDVGCGSGAIAITVALETEGSMLATEVSEAAAGVARRNARVLGAKIDLIVCDLASAIDTRFDAVISNPPYIASSDRSNLQTEVRDWEPGIALFSGASGLDFYGRLFRETPRVLFRGGFLVVELGFGEMARVRALAGPEWRVLRVYPDLADIPRVLLCQLR